MKRTIALPFGAAALLASGAARAAEPPAEEPYEPFGPRGNGQTVQVRRAPQPNQELGYHRVTPRPSLLWLALQLLPSPEVALGRQKTIGVDGAVDRGVSTTWGLRWQATPLLWSFGVHRAQPRWRTFVVDPIARHSGSIELSTSFEYVAGDIDRVLVRPGIRTYLPVAQRGEYLSVSLGTSVYAFESALRVAYDVGAYTLGGLFGVQLTLAPTHAPLTAIGTFRIRYF